MDAKPIPDDALEFFRQHGARGGQKSAIARMEKMTAEQRRAVARKAAAASAKVRSTKAAARKRAHAAEPADPTDYRFAPAAE